MSVPPQRPSQPDVPNDSRTIRLGRLGSPRKAVSPAKGKRGSNSPMRAKERSMSPTRRERIELERQVLNEMMMGGSHSESQLAASASNPGEPSIQQQAVQRGVTQLDVQKPDTQSAPPVALDVKALELSIEQMESQKAHAVRCEDFVQAHKAKLQSTRSKRNWRQLWRQRRQTNQKQWQISSECHL